MMEAPFLGFTRMAEIWNSGACRIGLIGTSIVELEGDLGTISLGILYVSFDIFSIVASLVVKKLGSKNALVLGTTGYWLFSSNLKPSWYSIAYPWVMLMLKKKPKKMHPT